MISVGSGRPWPTNACIRIQSKDNSSRLFWAGALLLGLVVAAYWPALRGGFVWDDDAYFTYNRIRAADGLRRIWLTRECADYWPVTSTSLWIEWRLWGGNTLGYHLVNLALHGGEALLFWSILRRLGIGGGYLAALLFVLHPVNVESVAWIAERKNLMAMLWFLVTVRLFLRTRAVDPAAGPAPPLAQFDRWYFLSLGAFVLALLSKALVAMAPVVLVGIAAWRRPLGRNQAALFAPFFALAAGAVLLNVWFQEHGYAEVVRAAGLADRIAAAGSIIWFYLSKALVPVRLLMVYPQWSPAAGRFASWLPPACALGLTALLWRCRDRWGPAPAWAWGYFCVMLVPVLGFTDVYFMRYSLVADHYQHLAILGVAALAGAGWAKWQRAARSMARTAAAAVIIILWLLAWSQAGLYRDAETLYLATLRGNPSCWLAHNNLGMIWAGNGRLPEAISHFQRALQLNPEFAEAHSNMGTVFSREGRPADAMAEYREAIRLRPVLADARNGLGNSLVDAGRLEEAFAQLSEALRLQPDFPEARNGMGNLLAKAGRPAEAVRQYEIALSLRPIFPEAENNLGAALNACGRGAEAIAHLERAIRLNPGYADAENNLGLILQQAGRAAEARLHFARASALRAARGSGP